MTRSFILSTLAVVIATACSTSEKARPVADAGTRRLDPGPHRPLDAGADGGDAGACVPTKSELVPQTWRPPSALHNAVCNPQQVAFIVRIADTLEMDAALTQEWEKFKAATENKNCLDCALKPIDASPRGPLFYDSDGWWYANSAGCVAALSQDTTPNGCGGRLFTLEQCEAVMCFHCADSESWWNCAVAADDTACAQYASGIQCSAPYYERCYGSAQDTWAQSVTKLVNLFCTAG